MALQQWRTNMRWYNYEPWIFESTYSFPDPQLMMSKSFKVCFPSCCMVAEAALNWLMNSRTTVSQFRGRFGFLSTYLRTSFCMPCARFAPPCLPATVYLAWKWYASPSININMKGRLKFAAFSSASFSAVMRDTLIPRCRQTARSACTARSSARSRSHCCR